MSLSGRPLKAVATPISLSVLDGFRGVLALYVVVFHAWGLLWLGGLDPANELLPTTGMPGLFSALAANLRYGHQAVLGFFLISGFCIHYRQAQICARGEQGHEHVAT